MKKKNVVTIVLLSIIIFMLIIGVFNEPVRANEINNYIMILTSTPTINPNNEELPVVKEQDTIKKVITAYFDKRYHALSTLNDEELSTLFSNKSDTESFVSSEIGKLNLEIEHAKINHLGYVNYEYFLDYQSITSDPSTNTITVVVSESRDVVYELSVELDPENPITSHQYDIVHSIILREESGKWKIISDNYSDYLWLLLRKTEKSPYEVLDVMEMSILPSKSEEKLQQEFTCTSLPLDDSFHEYDRAGAANYANEHADENNFNNLNYVDFTNMGGDCTNFVSQAIYEGGNASMAYPDGDQGVGTAGWYFTDINNRAAEWTLVEEIYHFITTPDEFHEGPEGCDATIDDVDVGDIVQYEWNDIKEGPDGVPIVWDHSTIITDIIDGIPYVASHTPNCSNEPYNSLDYFGDHEDIRFIHIERLDITSPRGFDENGVFASYYNDVAPSDIQLEVPIYWDTFTTFVLSQFEEYIAFNTGITSPAPGVNGTFWSAYWNGTLHVPEDNANYKFYIKNVDDGARIFIDDMVTPIIESWRVQGYHNYESELITLTAGEHTIRVDYAQGPGNDGGLIVEWGLEDDKGFREKIGPYSEETSSPTPTQTLTPTHTFTPTNTSYPTQIPSETPSPTSSSYWPPAEKVLMSDESEEKSEAFSDLLSQIRDEVMAKSSNGDDYIKMVYNHAPEIMTMISKDEKLRLQVKELALEVEPLLHAMVNDSSAEKDLYLEKDWIEDAIDVMTIMQKQASPELQKELNWWIAELPEFAGKTGLEIWKSLP